jgi:hypothetical protein
MNERGFCSFRTRETELHSAHNRLKKVNDEIEL